MGHRRTILRKQEIGFVTKKNRVGDHKITEARGVPHRRSTPEIRGTKSMFERIGVPKSVLRALDDTKLYDLRYHFTKGFRVNIARKTA